MIKLPEELENRGIDSKAQKRGVDYYFSVCPLCGMEIYGLNHVQVNMRSREHVKICKGDVNKHSN